MLFVFTALVVVAEAAAIVVVAVLRGKVAASFAAAFVVVFAVVIAAAAVSTAVVAVVAAVIAVTAIVAAAVDAERRFFSDLDRCRVRFFGQELDGSGYQGGRVVVGQEFFGIFFVRPEIAFFCRRDQAADGGLLGAFQGFREGRGLAAGDAALDEAFDGPQVFHFAGDDEGRRFTALTGTAGTADAVDVAFRVLRKVVVEDVGNAADVEAAGGDVGSDKDVDGLFTELADDRIALGLGQVAVDAFSRVTALLEGFRHFVDAAFGADEDDGQVRFLQVQETAEDVEFLAVRHFDVGLFDEVHRDFFGLHADDERVVQERFCQLLDRLGHGSREEQGLARIRRSGHDEVDVIDEAHVQHFVGFVEDDGRDVAQIDGAAFHVVDEAARRGDDDLRAFAQAAQLAFHILAAVDRQGLDVGELGQVVQFFGNLHGQFTRRRQDDGLDILGRFGFQDFFQDRDAVGCGLTRTGLGLADHVAAAHGDGNRFSLDRCRFFKAHFIQGTDNDFANIQILEFF